jgi:hypothetical protein
MALPGNCNVAKIPVLAYKGATGADYQRLMEGGFLLNYLNEDFSQCDACSVGHGHGHCRTFVSDDGFQCYCSDGVYSTACGEFGYKYLFFPNEGNAPLSFAKT